MVKVVPIRRLGGLLRLMDTLFMTHRTETRAFNMSRLPHMHISIDCVSGSHQHRHGAVSGNLQGSLNIDAYNSMDSLIYHIKNEIQ